MDKRGFRNTETDADPVELLPGIYITANLLHTLKAAACPDRSGKAAGRSTGAARKTHRKKHKKKGR